MTPEFAFQLGLTALNIAGTALAAPWIRAYARRQGWFRHGGRSAPAVVTPVQSGPRVIRKSKSRTRRRVLRPVPVGGAK